MVPLRDKSLLTACQHAASTPLRRLAWLASDNTRHRRMLIPISNSFQCAHVRPRPSQPQRPLYTSATANAAASSNQRHDDASEQQHFDRSAMQVASHYRSAIPFKAQFTSEKVRRSKPTPTATGVNTPTASNKASTRPALRNAPVSHMNIGFSNMPHPKKRFTGGEDAYAVTKGQLVDGSYVTVLAVYDGVGSWSVDKDVDAGLFSKQLAKSTYEVVESSQQSGNPLTPSSILDYTWRSVCEQKIAGGSTACIITHRHGSQQVQCANLGDSGFMVLRPTQCSNSDQYKLSIVFHSTFQWHYFNCPLQLGINKDGATDQFDQPSAADVFSVPVQANDIIVLSTDGLYDNITDDEFVAKLEECWNRGNTPQQISETLVAYAAELSHDKMIESPFCIMAREENILWRGGRPDDMTAIVAFVEAEDG